MSISEEAAKKIQSVKILGGGCAKCNSLEKATREALDELGLKIEIEHVKDYGQIASYGVMSTPVSNGMIMIKPKVAFICVHNSCRSQMAEALGKKFGGELFESYSAGTKPNSHINPDAVTVLKKHYGIDMEQTQFCKTLEEIPAVDIVITMGCNVNCPYLPCRFREDWGIPDPTGKEESVFIETAEVIKEKIISLANGIRNGQIFSL